MKKITSEYSFTPAQREAVDSLAAACGLHRLTASILFSRGIDTPEKADRFLHPSRRHFLSPFLMRGMRELVDALADIRAQGGTVGVFGDYDADGIGAASILCNALRRYGIADVVVHVPERSEGYGMSVEALREMIDEHAPSLIVTVDCGVSNREEVEYIKSRGVRVIVTDHHELPDTLPDCVVINPKLADEYPYDNLCGAGVAFKIACALLGEKAYDLLDLAAVSTVADSVPLVGENRDIVSEGLRLINRRPREAFRQLLAGKKDEATAQSLAFTIAPRINAAGRMGDANCALRLFTSQDKAEIYDLAARLNSYNLERQQVCDEVYRSAKAKIAREGAFGNIIMLYDESWSTGLVGIVAARIAEEFNRPAILFVKRGDVLKGSARTIENVNIYEALKACSQYIAEFGGHAQAAGVNVREEDFAALRDALDDYLASAYVREDFLPSLSVCDAEGERFDLALAKELELLEPCGVGNKKPLFALELASVPARRLKDGSPHISLRTDTAELVWFGGEKALPLLASDIPKRVVFECGISRFRGEESVRGIVRDMVCEGVSGEKTALYVFRNNLLRLLSPRPAVSVIRAGAAEVCESVRMARAACDYGLLLLCSERVPAEFSECVRGLDTEFFRLGSSNVGNALLVSPAADADFSMYRDIVWLDSPADLNVASFDGKKVLVNREICGYNSIAGLETSREFLGELYRCLRSGLRGEDSVAAALGADLPCSHEQAVFAIEVFLELRFARFEGGRLVFPARKKTELGRSAIYRAVCALKERA